MSVAFFNRIISIKPLFFFSLLIAIVLGVFFVAAWHANTDLTEGRFALFMDKKITFDGVKKILHHEGVKSFLSAVLDGGDHRYGRSLWNSIALFAFIPEKLWGDAGQIIATRTFQVLLLFATFLIFAFGLIRSWPLRLCLLVSLLAMPYAEYFMTMPKPEPLQLFFLALFFFFYSKKSLGYDWHYLFLGLAFGTKISTLPAVVVVVTVSLLAANTYRDRADLWLKMKKAAVFFLLGLGIAVPILLPAILAGIIVLSIEFSSLKTIYRWLPVIVKLPALFFVVNFFQGGIKTWLDWIRSGLVPESLAQLRFRVVDWVKYSLNEWFISTSQDRFYYLGTGLRLEEFTSFNFPIGNWIRHILNEGFLTPQVLIVLFLVTTFLFVVFSFSFRPREKFYLVFKNDIGFVLLACGIALIVSIFLSTNRIWGHYLFPGLTLACIGLFNLLDQTLFDSSQISNRFFLRSRQYLAKGIISLGLFFLYIFWMPTTFSGLKSLSHRTRSQGYVEQYTNYRLIVDFLEKKSAQKPKKKLVVVCEPIFFQPESNDKYHIIEHYSRELWDTLPDMVILGRDRFPPPRGTPPPEDSYNHQFFLLEREGYTKYVLQEKRYRVAMILPNGGEILELVPSAIRSKEEKRANLRNFNETHSP